MNSNSYFGYEKIGTEEQVLKVAICGQLLWIILLEFCSLRKDTNNHGLKDENE